MKWRQICIASAMLVSFLAMMLAFLAPHKYDSPFEKTKTTPVSRLLGSNPNRPSVPPDSRISNSNFTAFDESIREIAAAESLELAPQADWLTVCRRISLALHGSGMSIQDIQELESLPESERVSTFLESCLADNRWSYYWAERFTRAFVGDNEGPFLLYRRRKFRMWLADNFQADRPYDELASQLVNANGLWTDHPEVNFYTATADGEETNRADPIRIAGRTARVFLGQRIDCLQCHDDFLGTTNFATEEGERPGTQIDFHHLASFFGGASFTNPFSGLVIDDRPYEAILLGDSDPSIIKPSVPFDQENFNEELPPREAFAAWLTGSHNKHFARATTNRLWALMTGRPLVDPVDHITNDALLFEPLNLLAERFVTDGYSFKSLVRTIVMTEAFQRSSRSDSFEPTTAHENCFAVYPVSRLRPEQIALSLIQATQIRRMSDDANILQQLTRNDTVNNFVRDFGDLGDAELNGLAPTVTQRLLLMNGAAIDEATKHDLIANTVSRIGSFAKNEDEKIDRIYLLTLNRYPSPTERDAVRRELFDSMTADETSDRRSDEIIRACGDLAYALLNSAELQWNH